MPFKEDLPHVHLLGQEPPGEEFYHLLITTERKLQTEPCSSVHKLNFVWTEGLLFGAGSCAGLKG